MPHIKYLSQIVLILINILIVGCATTSESPVETPLETQPEIQLESDLNYKPDSSSTAPTYSIFPIDLQTIVTNVIDTLLESRAIGNHKPLVAFSEIKDNTSMSLDVKSISSQIRSQLLNSGKVRLIADESSNEINENSTLHLRDNSRPIKSRFDKPKANNYRLITVIHDTPPKAYNINAQYYRVTSSLLDQNSGDLIWIEEKDNVVRGKKN